MCLATVRWVLNHLSGTTHQASSVVVPDVHAQTSLNSIRPRTRGFYPHIADTNACAVKFLRNIRNLVGIELILISQELQGVVMPRKHGLIEVSLLLGLVV